MKKKKNTDVPAAAGYQTYRIKNPGRITAPTACTVCTWTGSRETGHQTVTAGWSP